MGIGGFTLGLLRFQFKDAVYNIGRQTAIPLQFIPISLNPDSKLSEDRGEREEKKTNKQNISSTNLKFKKNMKGSLCKAWDVVERVKDFIGKTKHSRVSTVLLLIKSVNNSCKRLSLYGHYSLMASCSSGSVFHAAATQTRKFSNRTITGERGSVRKMRGWSVKGRFFYSEFRTKSAGVPLCT